MSEENFNIKGLSFNKKDLEIIKLDDLGKQQVSPGHIIFISAKLGKPVLLLRAGDFVDPVFVKKYKEKGQESFYMYKVSNDDNISYFESLWTKIKIARTENERIVARQNFLKTFANLYWYHEPKTCSLDFYTACINTFLRLSDEIIIELRETSTLLCERSMQIAALSAVSALTLGYNDFEIISDIFHVSFLLDFGLIGSRYSYFIAQACEKERAKPGEGLKFLTSVNAPKEEIELFKKHPQVSHQDVFKKCYGAFYNLEMMKLLSYHHEFMNGEGFPQKLNYWGLSEIETIPILMDTIVPYDEFMYTKDSGGGILKMYLDQAEQDGKVDILPVRKIYERISFEMAKALGEAAKEEKANEEKELEETNNNLESDSLLEKFGT